VNDIFLTNSLKRKKEKFVALAPPNVGIYTCGPTVYDYAHIGNFRTYTTADILIRALEYNGYKVNYVMNLTDVGHLTGDNIGDSDRGVDRMEEASKREGKSAWDIAKFYTGVFINDMDLLNLRAPNTMPKATDHIKEQIQLVQKLETKKFTYATSDGIYFDTKGFEQKTGKKYGELSTLDKIKEGARVDKNREKKDARDFALWKFTYPGGRSFDLAQDDVFSKRQMEWESPWGIGFPGWHIECSAMSMKYLGESFDIHIGGEDLRSTHHPNEIAQSEAATGERFVKYWIHATFLQVEGKRMSKSSGNIFTIGDIVKKKIDPLALRYLYLTANYRDTLNFTWEALYSAQSALDKLRQYMLPLQSNSNRTSLSGTDKDTSLSEAKKDRIDNFNKDFASFINDDLNTSRGLAVLWEVLKSSIPSKDKYELVLSFDEVLGLRIKDLIPVKIEKIQTDSGVKIYSTTPLSTATISRIELREITRSKGDFQKADEIRLEIENKDKLRIEDTAGGTIVKPTHNGE